MGNIFKTIMIVCFTFFLFTNMEVSASSTIATKCHYDSAQNVNPDISTMNCLLTETALSYNVPPEIVKAIAEGESGDWRHFDANGEVIVTADNGIGIMQLTNQSQYDEERLRNDIVYNINAGVETLDRMFKRNDLPTINGGKREILDHWYFAIMAYNGTKPVNSPIIQATGERNPDAYQEKIINIIEKLGLIKLERMPFTRDDFNYDSTSTSNIEFTTKNYHFNLPFTKSKHFFVKGQKVGATVAMYIRTQPTTDSASKMLRKGEILTIQDLFKYEEASMRKNHFVWYPVKRSDGTTGYVASSYLKEKFIDVPATHYAEEEIYYLVDRDILYGVGNNKFGLSTNLTRWQAVLLITRANHVSLVNRPDPSFTDVPTDHPYFAEIAAAVDEELFQGKSETTFDPEATLTRSEMAVVLERLYQFPEASLSHPFTDIYADWYADAVARLYDSGITDGINATKFGPTETVTREQFAVFMVRSMDELFRLN